MCYRASVHHQTRVDSSEKAPAHVPGIRPRWVGVAAAVFVVTAAAAFAVLPLVRDASADQRTAGAQLAATALAQPVALDRVSTTSLPADDGVPSNTIATSQVAGQDCHHSQ